MQSINKATPESGGVFATPLRSGSTPAGIPGAKPLLAGLKFRSLGECSHCLHHRATPDPRGGQNLSGVAGLRVALVAASIDPHTASTGRVVAGQTRSAIKERAQTAFRREI